MNNDIFTITKAALEAASPKKNVTDALKTIDFKGAITLVAVGKAAQTMADAAEELLGDKIKKGFVLTKYDHSHSMSEKYTVREAAHPTPDENCVKFTEEIIDAVSKLSEDDTLLFLVSGGASSLFCAPVIDLESFRDITKTLLRSGADITEINTIRKRLSKVKGGRFAKLCKCHIDCIILSDVLGDRLDVIASGPCCEDKSTKEEALEIFNKYLASTKHNNDSVKKYLSLDMPKELTNVKTYIAGNVEMLCKGAQKKATELGYNAKIMSVSLEGEARDKTKEIIGLAKTIKAQGNGKTTLIYGGETTVTVHGDGLGGRNQEAALAACVELRDTHGITFLSIGSDGTDGPTDAAGGFADGETYEKMLSLKIDPKAYLDNNDSYNALKQSGNLMITGATGTNVNDIIIVLIN